MATSTDCEKHDIASRWSPRQTPAQWGRKKAREIAVIQQMFHAPTEVQLHGGWKELRRPRCQSTTEAERVFASLADKWRDETEHVSSTTDLVMNAAYQQIIGLGRQAVPLILRDLRRSPAHWFWALAAITRENPISRDDAGNVGRMTAAWLRWGRDKNLL